MLDNIPIWREDLPLDCPPVDAFTSDGKVYYRLTESIIALNGDFDSERFKWPFKKFKVPECIAKAVSIFEDEEGIEIIRKFPNQKHKFVQKLLLTNDAGLIKKTGNNGHHSWWIKKEYNPLEAIIKDEENS